MESALENGWWNELKKYWSKVEDQTKLSLRLIKRDRIENGLLFDEKFKRSFLRTTYTRIGDAFEQFLKDERAKQSFFNDVDSEHRGQQNQSSAEHHSTNTKQNKSSDTTSEPKQIIDKSNVSHLQMEPLNTQSPRFADGKDDLMVTGPNNANAGQRVHPVASSSNTKNTALNGHKSSNGRQGIADKVPAEPDPSEADYVYLISDQEEEAVEQMQLMTEPQITLNNEKIASGNVRNERKLANAADIKKRRYNCDFCDYSTGHKTKLTNHIRTHTGERPFECAVCNKRFNREYVLNRHMETHRDLFQFQCLNCHQGFSDEMKWKSHQICCKARGYECHLCKKIFLSKQCVVDHMRAHTGDTLDCSICRKEFSSNDARKMHMKSHGNIFRFQCTKCRKGFSKKAPWKLHESRCKSKQYECFLCSKAFHQKKNNLLVHMRHKHTGEKPFGCSDCSMRFCSKQHLAYHTKRCHLNDN